MKDLFPIIMSEGGSCLINYIRGIDTTSDIASIIQLNNNSTMQLFLYNSKISQWNE